MTSDEDRAERDRIFAVYLRRHGIDLTDMMRMDDAEIERLRADALANRHLYPVPTTEPDYLYHGTSRARLPLIAQDGLIPSQRSRWTKDGYEANCLGRVFFTKRVDGAEFYAREASKSCPLILRVRRDALADMQDDPKETEGNYFVEREVSPEQVEAWTAKGWTWLREPVLTVQGPSPRRA